MYQKSVTAGGFTNYAMDFQVYESASFAFDEGAALPNRHLEDLFPFTSTLAVFFVELAISVEFFFCKKKKNKKHLWRKNLNRVEVWLFV